MSKPFSWSFSRLKNYEECPLRYQQVDLLKNFQESTAQLAWGNEVHDRLAKALKGTEPLPDTMKTYLSRVASIRKWPGELMVEQKYALTKDLQPSEYFGPHAWYRGIGDVVGLITPTKGIVLDWKTGKVTPNSVQLMLMAQCVMSFHPDLHSVDSAFIWLQHDTMTKESYHRDAMAKHWVPLLPRIQALEQATATDNFPPKPGRLCARYCPVTSCVHNGRYKR